MQIKSLPILLALAVLLLQLVSISPSISFGVTSFGSITSVPAQDSPLLPQRLYQATFSSYEKDSKDALIFTGDVLLARNVEFLMNQKGSDYPFKSFALPSLAANASVIGNFESAMPQIHRVTQAMQMNFSVNPLFLPALKDAGFTHLSLANNHSFDYGFEGYQNAVRALEENHMVAFGNGETIEADSLTYIDTKGGRVALVAVNASQRLPDKTTLRNALAVAGHKSDIQIVYVHWGNEYEKEHSYVQEELAHFMVESGADLIIGHHPHVVQDVAVINGVVVFYSLGNYIFDQYFSSDVQEGLVLSLEMSEPEPRIRLIPVSSHAVLSQPATMAPEHHRAFLQTLADASDPSLSADIKRGLIPLASVVATSQKMTMMVR